MKTRWQIQQIYSTSFQTKSLEAILNDDDPDDERQLSELLKEIDELLKMQEEKPKQFIEVMEGFSEDDDAPPYHDVLTGVMYNLRKASQMRAQQMGAILLWVQIARWCPGRGSQHRLWADVVNSRLAK